MTLVLKGGTLHLKGGKRIEGGTKIKESKKKKAKYNNAQQYLFRRLHVGDFQCPTGVKYKIYDVAADGNCFFYSVLRAMAAKGIPCSFGDEIFDIRKFEPSNPTDIFDGLIHDGLNLVKNDEFEAGKYVREKLYEIFENACNLYNQKKVSTNGCINDLIARIESMKVFGDPQHKTLLKDLNTLNNYMDTGNPLLQHLIECALKVKVRVYNRRTGYGGQWVDYLSNANPLANDVVNILFTGNHYKFMDPSEIRASGGSGRLRTLFEPSSGSSGSTTTTQLTDFDFSGSSSSSKSSGSSSNTTLSNDLQSLVDEGAITLQDAYQLMKSL